MKNTYSMLVLSAAMTIAASATAQNKQDGPARSPRLRASGAVAHHTSLEMRGGAPANDNCAGVTFQSLAVGGSLTFSGDNTGATDTDDFESGSGLEGFGPVVWHGFTTTECANLTLAYCGQDPAWQNLAAFLARTCPATDADYVTYSAGNFDECGDGNATIYFNDVPAGSYYLPVLMDDSASAVGAYSIALSAAACVPPPPAPDNDDCASANSLPVSDWCNFQYFSGVGATESQPAITCNDFTGDASDDVWFSFVATAADMTIAVQGTDDGDGDNNTGYDAVVELLSGNCASGTLTCADASLGSELEQIDATGLTVGTTYYVRVYDWYSALWPDHTFGICITTNGQINIGIEETPATSFSLYPNPGTGVFGLNYSGASGLANIEVMDVTGRTVRSERARVTNGAVLPLDLGGVATGNYNVRLTVNGTRTEQRLMVK